MIPSTFKSSDRILMKMIACSRAARATERLNSIRIFIRRHLTQTSSQQFQSVTSTFAGASNEGDGSVFNDISLNEYGQAKSVGMPDEKDQFFNQEQRNSLQENTSGQTFDSSFARGGSITHDEEAFLKYCTGDGVLYEDSRIVAIDKPAGVGKVSSERGGIGIRTLLPQLSDIFHCRSQMQIAHIPEPRCSGIVLLSKSARGAASISQAFRRGFNRPQFHSQTYLALCNVPAAESVRTFEPSVNDTVHFRPVILGSSGMRYQVLPRDLFDDVTKAELKVGKYGLRLIDVYKHAIGIRIGDEFLKRRRKKTASNNDKSIPVQQYETYRAVVELKTSGEDWYLYRIYCAFRGFPIAGDEIYGPQAQSVFGVPILAPPVYVDKLKPRELLCLHLRRLTLPGYKKKGEDFVIQTKALPTWFPEHVVADV